MESYDKDKAFKDRERRRIELQKRADSNVTIKKGKRVINNVSTKSKVKQGKQTHGRSNDAGSGLNPQQRKTKEERKLKNVQDITNENASIITACTDNSSVEGSKKRFDDVMPKQQTTNLNLFYYYYYY